MYLTPRYDRTGPATYLDWQWQQARECVGEDRQNHRTTEAPPNPLPQPPKDNQSIRDLANLHEFFRVFVHWTGVRAEKVRAFMSHELSEVQSELEETNEKE